MSVTGSNQTKNTASGTNQAKKGIFGDLTMAELANTTLDRWVNTTFLTPMVLGTNQTKY